MRILNLDGVYPEVFEQMAATPHGDWRSLRDAILAVRFGCWDSWSNGMREHGAHAEEAFVDGAGFLSSADGSSPLDEEWDVVVVRHPHQPLELLNALRQRAKLVVAMVSSEAPDAATLAGYTHVITAFPHYAAANPDWLYLPLAFDPRHLEVGRVLRAPFPVTFVGGMGVWRHWQSGQHAINAVAEAFDDFQWWGYVGGDAHVLTQPLRAKHQGAAWGSAYFNVLQDSTMTINRHGEVHRNSKGKFFACNMRLYEATGCGALLFTEDSDNLGAGWSGWPEGLFEPFAEVVPYRNPTQLVELVRHYQKYPEDAAAIAAAGQVRTLNAHTYTHRAANLLEWLEGLLHDGA